MIKTAHRKTDVQGFTLIEVLIAMVILAVGILALIAMHVASIQGNATAKEMTEASALATDKLEELLAGPYKDIKDQTTPEVVDGKYQMTWEITADQFGTVDTKTVFMKVKWFEGDGKEKNIELRHIIPSIDR